MIKKHKISISVGEETLIAIREGIRKGIFRNRSHAFEFSVKHALEQAISDDN